MAETSRSDGAGAVIVTGGGRGIGAAIATLAGARGYAVAVNYVRNEAAARGVVRDIQRAGGRAAALRGDVSREEDVRRVFDAAERELGQLAALVNNAGVTGGFSRFEALSFDVVRHVLLVNVAGAMLCAREAIRRMSIRSGGRGGSIVNVSSRAAQLGGAGEWVHYAATKGAIESLTIGLAREVAGDGIRVNTVSPGVIETDLHASAGAPDRAARLAPTIPLGRAGTPQEVAEGVLWLISPAASYVTGAILTISGGR